MGEVNLFYGDKFERLTVIAFIPGKRGERGVYLCVCECGKTTKASNSDLKNGKMRSCGCLHIEVIRRKKLRPFEGVFKKIVEASKKRKFLMDLSYEEFLEFTNVKFCEYCGTPIKWCPHRIREFGYGGYNLDRKNSTLGYTKSNLVVCCPGCNWLKSDVYTYEEFMLIASAVRLVKYLKNPLSKNELPYMHTHSGKFFRYLHPDPEDLAIEDVAHGLSQLCRFVGQVKVPYSVAQHSVLVSYVCPPEHSLWGLLHDASEAYVSDICRVLKMSPGMEIYKFYENLTMQAICSKFSLVGREPAEVKKADNILLITEKRDLFNTDCSWALNKNDTTEEKPLPEMITPWTPEEAERIFLMRFYELTGTKEFYKT